jgi:hypothetical protein
MPKNLFKTAWLFLRSPEKAAREHKKPQLDTACLWLYVSSVLAFMLLFWVKPFDFPDRIAAVPPEMQDFGYWLKAELWNPVLEAGWVFFLLALLRFYRSGSWPVRLASSVLWTVAPYVLIVAYARPVSFPKWAFAFGSGIWLASYFPVIRRAGKSEWWPLINFSMGVNVIMFPIVALLSFALILHVIGIPSIQIAGYELGPEKLFMGVQIGGGLWLLAASTVGIRELTGLRLPRAFMAVILSLFLQAALAICLHFLGAPGVLAALLYG